MSFGTYAYGRTPFADKTEQVASGATGTVAVTNANDTSAASGKTTIVGTLARTNANDTSAASGSVGSSITGTVAVTNANDTSAASGTTTVTGTAARTNANDASSASGTTTITGTVARTNANDVATASGAAGSVSGTVSYTNRNDTCAASGSTPQSTTFGGSWDWVWSQGKRRKKEAEELAEEVIASPDKVDQVLEEVFEDPLDKEAAQAIANIRREAKRAAEAAKSALMNKALDEQRQAKEATDLAIAEAKRKKRIQQEILLLLTL